MDLLQNGHGRVNYTTAKATKKHNKYGSTDIIEYLTI